MRELFRYRILRYYPSLKSDEFLNVGIFLKSQNNKEISVLICDDKKHYKKFLKMIGKNKEAFKHHFNSVKEYRDLTHSYGEYLRFSDTMVMTSERGAKYVLKTLYRDFIGYKF